MGVDGAHNALLSDLILENYPWKQFLVQAVKSRTLPLWDPDLFAGHPFLANGQHSALYPLTWLFFVIPPARAFGVFIVLQLGLAGVWMYVLGRVIGAGRVGCPGRRHRLPVQRLHGRFCGPPYDHRGCVLAAAPVGADRVTITRRRFWLQARAMLPWALLGAAALGLQTLAGHAEITYFVLLVMGAFAGWRLIHRLLTHPRAAWRTRC